MEKITAGETGRNEQVDILLEQLKALSQEDRILLGLYFYEKLSFNEIAVILNRNVQAVEQHIQRISAYISVKTAAMAESEDHFMEIFG